MTPQMVVDIIRHALIETFWLSLPLLAVGFVVGIIVSLVQVLTSIQDTAFGAAPRLVAFLVGILVMLPWMISRIVSYTSVLLGDFSRYAR